MTSPSSSTSKAKQCQASNMWDQRLKSHALVATIRPRVPEVVRHLRTANLFYWRGRLTAFVDSHNASEGLQLHLQTRRLAASSSNFWTSMNSRLNNKWRSFATVVHPRIISPTHLVQIQSLPSGPNCSKSITSSWASMQLSSYASWNKNIQKQIFCGFTQGTKLCVGI